MTHVEFDAIESGSSPDEDACTDCDCVYLDANFDLFRAKCTESRKYLCEYKGERNFKRGFVMAMSQLFARILMSKWHDPSIWWALHRDSKK